MGSTKVVMGQVESKVFVETPPWDLEEIDKVTDLDKDTVNLLWRQWATDSKTKKGKVKFDVFSNKLSVNLDEDDEAKKIFNLIDEDDDGKVEFPDIMLFLFCLDEKMTKEQELRRSYYFYDRNRSGKISKEEMLDALVDLGKITKQATEESGKGEPPKIPDEVENLFSLMDFASDKRISEKEFLRATLHYRRLGNLLKINYLEKNRQDMVRQIKTMLANAETPVTSTSTSEQPFLTTK